MRSTDLNVIVDWDVDGDKIYGHVAKCIKDHGQAIESVSISD